MSGDEDSTEQSGPDSDQIPEGFDLQTLDEERLSDGTTTNSDSFGDEDDIAHTSHNSQREHADTAAVWHPDAVEDIHIINEDEAGNSAASFAEDGHLSSNEAGPVVEDSTDVQSSFSDSSEEEDEEEEEEEEQIPPLIETEPDEAQMAVYHELYMIKLREGRYDSDRPEFNFAHEPSFPINGRTAKDYTPKRRSLLGPKAADIPKTADGPSEMATPGGKRSGHPSLDKHFKRPKGYSDRQSVISASERLRESRAKLNQDNLQSRELGTSVRRDPAWTDAEELSVMINTYIERNVSLSNQCRQFYIEYDSLRGISQDHSYRFTELDNFCADLERQLDQNEYVMKALESTIGDFHQELSDAKDCCTRLRKETGSEATCQNCAGLQQDIVQFEEMLESFETQITSLNVRLESAVEQAQNRNQKDNGKARDLKLLTIQNEELHQDHSHLKSQFQELHRENSHLISQFRELSDQLKSTKIAYSDKCAEVDQFESKAKKKAELTEKWRLRSLDLEKSSEHHEKDIAEAREETRATKEKLVEVENKLKDLVVTQGDEELRESKHDELTGSYLSFPYNINTSLEQMDVDLERKLREYDDQAKRYITDRYGQFDADLNAIDIWLAEEYDIGMLGEGSKIWGHVLGEDDGSVVYS